MQAARMVLYTLLPSSPMNFCESDQSSVILEKLWRQREAGRLCDVILHVEGEKFQAHRNVLAACSQYFDSIFKTRRTTREQLNVTCQNLDAFRSLLNYMYTGKIAVESGNVIDILQLADFFLVPELKCHCAEYLNSNMDQSNCLSICEMAETYNLQPLFESASTFININVIYVLYHKEILRFTFDKLEIFLRPKLSLISQYVLLNFISKWVGYDVHNRKNAFRKLLGLIDWKSFEKDRLDDFIKTCPLLEDSKCMYVFLDHLEQEIDISDHKDVFQNLKAEFSKVEEEGFADGGAPINPSIEAHDESNDNILEHSSVLKDWEKEKHGAVGDAEKSNMEVSSTNKQMNSARKCSRKGVPWKITYKSKRKKCEKLKLPMSKNSISETDSDSQDGTDDEDNSNTTSIVIDSNQVPQGSWKGVPRKTSFKSKRKMTSEELKLIIETDSDSMEDSGGEGSINTTSDTIDAHNHRPCDKVIEKTRNWKNGVKCPFCAYIAYNSIRLEQHVSKIHARDVTYKCAECDFTCKWNREYYKHMKTHFKGPPYRCEQCDYAGERVQYLLAHHKSHTDERPFQCEKCNHRSKTKNNLNLHMRQHTGEKPYQCEFCAMRFAQRTTLDQHLASHSEDRPHLCDTCGFTTKYAAHLQVHKKIHTGDVHHCGFPNCSYSTPRKHQLRCHQRIHSTVRSHTCSVCKKAFKDRSCLIRHERIHLKEKPFKCESSGCNYSSSRRDKLKEHFRKHHGENASAKRSNRQSKPRAAKNANANDVHISDGNDYSVEEVGNSSSNPQVYNYDNYPPTGMEHNFSVMTFSQEEQRCPPDQYYKY